MNIALIGNPNSGKTTLFNALTGMNQKVANWTGVTVEKKTGLVKKDKSIEIVDLPGIYSLKPFSLEEKIASDYIAQNKLDCIINIVDATNLERNLFLTTQLLDVKVPVVIALNLVDQLEINGLKIDYELLESRLGVKVVPISAKKGSGLVKLIEAVRAEKPLKKSIGLKTDADTKERYQAVTTLLDGVVSRGENKLDRITQKIDKVVTNKWLAFPIFAILIFIMYFVSIQLVGNYTTELLEKWIIIDFGNLVREGFVSLEVAEWFTSLMVDGVIAGVGSVLTFVPQIFVLFLFITFFEACGYMSRVAYIMDRVFKKVGLSGKSFIPMIVGCGCTVPAIMTARTIEKQDERQLTIMLTPFIPCSAKLPVFALFCGAFFPDNPLVAPSMYLIGIGVVLLVGFVLTKLKLIKKDNESFLLELPPYRLPDPKSMAISLWEKVRSFIVKAGTIIFLVSIVLWVLQSFNWTFEMVESKDSMLASIGKFFAPLFIPIGVNSWEASVAYITGFLAKENVVATLGVLLPSATEAGFHQALQGIFSWQSSYAYMVLILLSSPCIAALAATKKELGSYKKLLLTIAMQMVVAYVSAMLAYGLTLLYSGYRGIFFTVIGCIVLLILIIIAVTSVYKKKNRGGCIGCSGCSQKENCPSKRTNSTNEQK